MSRSTATVFAMMFSAATSAAPQVSGEQLLETHMKDEKSGSVEAGRPVFEKLCAGCHRFAGIGKDVGPAPAK